MDVEVSRQTAKVVEVVGDVIVVKVDGSPRREQCTCHTTIIRSRIAVVHLLYLQKQKGGTDHTQRRRRRRRNKEKEEEKQEK